MWGMDRRWVWGMLWGVVVTSVQARNQSSSLRVLRLESIMIDSSWMDVHTYASVLH